MRQVFLTRMIYALVLIVALSSCGSKKPRVVTTKKRAPRQVERKNNSNRETKTVVYSASKASSSTVRSVIASAQRYKGVRYRYGGNDRCGLDCSGLIHLAFKENDITVPRTTGSFKAATRAIDLKQIRPGDLLFFGTGKNKRRLNHVALVINTTPAEVQFIHSTTSRGVITSTLNEPYWLNAYLSAGRLK